MVENDWQRYQGPNGNDEEAQYTHFYHLRPNTSRFGIFSHGSYYWRR